jgi:hypothetical protein
MGHNTNRRWCGAREIGPATREYFKMNEQITTPHPKKLELVSAREILWKKDYKKIQLSHGYMANLELDAGFQGDFLVAPPGGSFREQKKFLINSPSLIMYEF